MATSLPDPKDPSGAPGASGGDGGGGEDEKELEKRLVDGDLPDDFLTVTEPNSDKKDPEKTEKEAKEVSDPEKAMTTEERDHAMALALQKQLNMEEASSAARNVGYHQFQPPPNAVGRLTVTVAEAKLTRNYGIARMDPYCRVRVGHCVYETPTCANGAREPKWNKTFNCFLLAGVKSVDVEIYDECTFQTDAMIAHATLPIPNRVTDNMEVVDQWWPLSGQEGHDKEGLLHLIMSLQPLPKIRSSQTIHIQPGQSLQIGQSQNPKPQPSEEQLKEFCGMFPNLDREVIVSVYQENRGNQESTVNGLLLISGS